MALAAVVLPLYPANSSLKTLFMLFVLQPLTNVCLAGVVLQVIQTPYRFLNWAPVAWLGRISYSLYLWQELFCSNTSLRLGYTLVIPALVCATFSYYVVEQPMLRLRDRVTRRHKFSSPAPEAAATERETCPGIPSSCAISG
jgi:peptidoglycan/LPS O-acetylase OafA/YrhL